MSWKEKKRWMFKKRYVFIVYNFLKLMTKLEAIKSQALQNDFE